MAERRRTRRKSVESNQKLTKEEEAIARYVRFNCSTRTTMFEGNEVHYFSGSKAVDTLMDSKKYGTVAKEPKFTGRPAAVAYLRKLMEKGLFFRARKLVPKRKEDKRVAKYKDKMQLDVNKSPKRRGKKLDADEYSVEADQNTKEKEKQKRKEEQTDPHNDSKNVDDDQKKDEDEKKKRKVKLECHQEQVFNDANDVYVWIFDPTPLFKKVIGALMVLGTIAGCLFPLWPIWLRQGVYYLSLAGLGCFGVLFGIAVARTILFAVIWACTLGKHKLWLLPNLTEDCGFFESFQPWYTYEYCAGGISSGRTKSKKDKEAKKEKKDSVAEESDPSVQSNGEKTYPPNNESSEPMLKDRDELPDNESENDNSEEGTASDGSAQSCGSGETSNDEHIALLPGEPKSQVRRRPRKTDEDFVFVEKQNGER